MLEERLVELQDLWDQLIAETDRRHTRLMDASRAQQFYADAAEAEAWMGEQELHMMSEEKAKVRRRSRRRVLGVVQRASRRAGVTSSQRDFTRSNKIEF